MYIYIEMYLYIIGSICFYNDSNVAFSISFLWSPSEMKDLPIPLEEEADAWEPTIPPICPRNEATVLKLLQAKAKLQLEAYPTRIEEVLAICIIKSNYS